MYLYQDKNLNSLNDDVPPSIKNPILLISQIDIGIGQGTLSAHGCTLGLAVVFAIKLKLIVFQQKFHNKHVVGSLSCPVVYCPRSFW